MVHSLFQIAAAEILLLFLLAFPFFFFPLSFHTDETKHGKQGPQSASALHWQFNPQGQPVWWASNYSHHQYNWTKKSLICVICDAYCKLHHCKKLLQPSTAGSKPDLSAWVAGAAINPQRWGAPWNAKWTRTLPKSLGVSLQPLGPVWTKNWSTQNLQKIWNKNFSLGAETLLWTKPSQNYNCILLVITDKSTTINK